MAEVTLKINNRGYGLFCDEGQESRLEELAIYVDSRLQDIAKSGAATNESHLLVLTSLVLADEVYELRDELNMLQRQLQDARAGLPVHYDGNGMSAEEEAMITQAIDSLANKIEQIAKRIHLAEEAA